MFRRIGILGIALVLSLSTLLAQPKDAIENRRNNWLITNAFPALDADKSMGLSMDELKSASGLLNFFSTREGFSLADADKNKSLSMAELMKMAKRAVEYTKKQEMLQFDELMSNKKVAKGAIGYLIRKDEITTQLFSNTQWISKNKDLVKKLVSNAKLLKKKPDVVKALLDNKRALIANPDLMASLLANKEIITKFPEFATSGSQLTKFLSSETEVLKKRMQLGKDKIEKMKPKLQNN